jgi:hypothetical protein
MTSTKHYWRNSELMKVSGSRGKQVTCDHEKFGNTGKTILVSEVRLSALFANRRFGIPRASTNKVARWLQMKCPAPC